LSNALSGDTAVYTGTLASRTVSSEIVYNMSAVRNIGKALTLFGLSDACESILFVLVGPTKTALTALEDLVDGALVEDVSAGLRAGVDLDAVQKIYDLTDAEVRAGTLVDSIVTRIAVRDMK
jgi:tRNA threonylcarbamoyladenosine modification (KEOPS) complex Cgi121 subunit